MTAIMEPAKRVFRWMAIGLLAAAGAGAARADESRPFRIMTSFYPMYVAALNVAGGVPGVEVANLTRPTTGCLHDYQLTPDDMKRLAGASVFVINGAGLEGFLDRARRATSAPVIDASAGLDLPAFACVGHAHDHGHEHDDEPNGHVWVSVTLHMGQVRNIADGLAAADPDRAESYRRNGAAYIQRLEALRDRMRVGLKTVKSRDMVTFHEAFAYFADEFGLRVVGTIASEPGAEPSARELAATIRTVKRTGVRALFVEPQYPARSAETIARETGARIHVLDPVASGPAGEPDAYIRIMEKNLAVLRQALGAE